MYTNKKVGKDAILVTNNNESNRMYLRMPGKENRATEQEFLRLDNGKLIVNESLLQQFGIELQVKDKNGYEALIFQDGYEQAIRLRPKYEDWTDENLQKALEDNERYLENVDTTWGRGFYSAVIAQLHEEIDRRVELEQNLD